MLVFDEAPRPYFIFQMFDDVDGHDAIKQRHI